ncbi:cytidylate kinase [bacterium M21]|nr:cytidylate kinase [bacterium M21]
MDGNQIAIDGPSASGKSTVARLVAERMNAYYVNTGEMYRTLTWVVRNRGIDPTVNPEAVEALLDEIEIRYALVDGSLTLTCDDEVVDLSEVRKPQVTAQVSQVAKIPAVRTWMVARQKQSAELGLVVAEGRDIGTVVFPDAKWKFFVTASPEERARRRLAQDGETSDGATLQEVALQIAERDRIDSTRKVSPLKQADDAVLVDTTGMSIDEVLDFVTSKIK